MCKCADLAKNIKSTAKKKRISVSLMLEQCGYGKNFITQIANGQEISAIKLARIADYLEVSVDYLLGREAYVVCDNVNLTHVGKAISSNINSPNGSITASDTLSEEEQMIITAYKKLNLANRARFLAYLSKLE